MAARVYTHDSKKKKKMENERAIERHDPIRSFALYGSRCVFLKIALFFSSICTWRATRCYAPFHLTALGMSAPFHFDSILTLE